jgi:hypothetical protein
VILRLTTPGRRTLARRPNTPATLTLAGASPARVVRRRP